MPRTVARAVAGIVFAAYPLVVWLWLSSHSPRWLAVLLLLLLLPAALLRQRGGGLSILPLCTAAALAAAALLDAAGGMLLVPVVVNGVLLTTFGATLRRGAVPMIERFARLQKAGLSPAEQAWCRRWTVVWCLFFVANGGTALLLALAAPLPWWALYNGLLAYLLIGGLLLLEYVLRRRRFAAGVERR